MPREARVISLDAVPAPPLLAELRARFDDPEGFWVIVQTIDGSLFRGPVLALREQSLVLVDGDESQPIRRHTIPLDQISSIVIEE